MSNNFTEKELAILGPKLIKALNEVETVPTPRELAFYRGKKTGNWTKYDELTRGTK
jgi:hypothetical protein